MARALKFAVLALLALAFAIAPAQEKNEYYVQKGASLVRVDASPNSIHPDYWQYWLYKENARQTGLPWARLTSETLEGVIDQLKLSQQIELNAKKYDANWHPQHGWTYFNEVGPVAIFNKNSFGLGGISDQLSFGVGGSDPLAGREADEVDRLAQTSLTKGVKLFGDWAALRAAIAQAGASLASKYGNAARQFGQVGPAMAEYGSLYTNVFDKVNALKDLSNTSLDMQIQQLNFALDNFDQLQKTIRSELDQAEQGLGEVSSPPPPSNVATSVGNVQQLMQTLRTEIPSPFAMNLWPAGQTNPMTQQFSISSEGVIDITQYNYDVVAWEGKVRLALSDADKAIAQPDPDGSFVRNNLSQVNLYKMNDPSISLWLNVPAGTEQQVAQTLNSLIAALKAPPQQPAQPPKQQAEVQVDPTILARIKNASMHMRLAIGSIAPLQSMESNFGQAPKPVKELYAREMTALESGNPAEISKLLAPDFYSQDANGMVTPRSKWVPAEVHDLKLEGEPRVSVHLESVTLSASEAVVRLTRTISGRGAPHRDEITQHWTRTHDGYLLQSESSELPLPEDAEFAKAPFNTASTWLLNALNELAPISLKQSTNSSFGPENDWLETRIESISRTDLTISFISVSEFPQAPDKNERKTTSQTIHLKDLDCSESKWWPEVPSYGFRAGVYLRSPKGSARFNYAVGCFLFEASEKAPTDRIVGALHRLIRIAQQGEQ